MFEEGLYELDYKAASDCPGVFGSVIGSGLAVLRGRKIIGTDRCGSIFIGAIDYDKRLGLSRVSIRIKVPPDGELVNGVAAGAEGTMIGIEAALDCGTNGSAAGVTVDIAGRPVTIALRYIGPLPN